MVKAVAQTVPFRGWAVIPTLISSLRLPMLAVTIHCLHSYAAGGDKLWLLSWALGLSVLSEFTDRWDGQAARANGWITDIGKNADPICDMVVHLTMVWSMVSIGWLPAWMFWIFLAREIVGYGIRITLYFEYGRIIFPALMSGKIKAVSQGVLIISTLTWFFLVEAVGALDGYPVLAAFYSGFIGGLANAISSSFYWVAIVMALVSGFDYVRSALGVMKENAQSRRGSFVGRTAVRVMAFFRHAMMFRLSPSGLREFIRSMSTSQDGSMPVPKRAGVLTDIDKEGVIT